MGKVHNWRPESRATITSRDPELSNHYLELSSIDDEDDVKAWWDNPAYPPDFVVAPHASDSRTNSVIGANIRRILPKDTLVAVMVHGKKKRERVDMTHWLIENEYLPMFPRYMPNVNSSVPLTRLQLIHEMRPILDRDSSQIFVCHNWRGANSEGPALDYIKSTKNSWELLG